MGHDTASLTFIHDRAEVLGVEATGDFPRLSVRCSNGMPAVLVPGVPEDAADLLEFGASLTGAWIVFGGYLRTPEPGRFHVTALSIGIEPAAAATSKIVPPRNPEG